MNKKSKKPALFIVSIVAVIFLAAYLGLLRNIKLTEISEDVFETDVFLTTNQKMYDWFSKNIFSANPGACSAVVTTDENGDVIIGRNMDFFISNKPGFIVRTKEKGKYETIGIAYYNEFIPDSDQVRRRGLPRLIYRMLPLFCQDVMNDQGLYIEVNMRYADYDKKGNLVFADTHTNPKSTSRTCIAGLNTRICQNCATVEEAIDYVRNLDIYSPSAPDMSWNFCYIIADATGDYGLLEVAKNTVSFLDKQQIQTNFYVTKEFYDEQQMKCGVGRYELLEKGVDGVKTEDDMFALIDSVKYSQSYLPEISNFDVRTEYIGEKPGWSYDYMMDDKNQDEVNSYIAAQSEEYKKLNRQELKDNGTYWESTYTNIANCNKKTMRVRFYEDDSNIVELTLGDN